MRRGDGWEHAAAEGAALHAAERPLRGARQAPATSSTSSSPTWSARWCSSSSRSRLVSDRDRSVHGKIDLALHHLRPARADRRRHAAAAAPARPRRVVAGGGAAWYVADVARADRRARLHRATAVAVSARRRIHRRAAARRRRRGARRADRRRPGPSRSRCSGGVSARTSPCSWPAARPSSGARRDPRRRARARRRPDGADVAELLLAPDRRLAPRTRTRWSNWAATCGRPTTPRRSSDWRSAVRRSTSRSPCTAVIRPEWLDRRGQRTRRDGRHPRRSARRLRRPDPRASRIATGSTAGRLSGFGNRRTG